MKKKMQRILAGLLAVLLVASTVDITAFASSKAEESAAGGQEGTSDAGDQAVSKGEAKAPLVVSEGDLQPEFLKAGEGEVSRIEWLQEIIATFDMRVDSDNYPDNYYSDVDDSDSYYVDIMVATEFGLIDTEAGEAFCPEDAATREFAAHSLNLAYGYTTYTEGYTFSESDQVTYPDDIQVSIDLEWFALSSGNFLPEQAVTIAEKTSIFEKVKNGLAQKDDIEGESGYQFKSEVIVLDAATEIITEDESTLRLVNYSGTALKAGDLFGIEYNGIPLAWYAKQVKVDGNDQVITIESVAADVAFDEIAVSSTLSVDYAQVVAADSVDLAYIVGGSEENDYEDAEIVTDLSGIDQRQVNGFVLNSDKRLQAGTVVNLGVVELKYDLRITDVVPHVTLKKNYTYVGADFKLRNHVECKGSLDQVQKLSDTLAQIPIAPGITYSPTIDFELEGKVTADHVEAVLLGICYENGGFRVDRSFQKESFFITSEVQCKLGAKISLSANCGGFSASITAKAGIAAKYTKVTYRDDQKPACCENLCVWYYAEVEAAASYRFGIGLGSVTKELGKKKWIIYDEKNSPVREAWHIEDGVQTAECSNPDRYKTGNAEYKYPGYNGTTMKLGYFAPLNSKYYYNGKSSTVSDGTNTYTIFTYSLDSYNQATITGYKGNAKYVYIPEKLDGYDVVTIGDRAFSGNTSILGVVIPDSVTSITSSAFSGCTSLSAVTLPNKLKTLGYEVFRGCKKLSEIHIPKSLTSVRSEGSGAFADSGLKQVTFEEGITQIPAYLFRGCTTLEEITIPDTVTQIGTSAFKGATGLKQVKFPASLQTIGDWAFLGCGIETIELPNGVVSIGSGTFRDCVLITEIVIPNSVTKLGSYAFCSCKKLANVTLSDHLSTMECEVFKDCIKLTEIHIPKSLSNVRSEGSGVFAGSGLKQVTFEEGITQIPAYLFKGCTTLEEITIPDTVTQIGTSAFNGATGLKQIKLSSSLRTIGEWAFSECGMETIELPNGVVSIGQGAFRNCALITEIAMPNSVTRIDSNAFSGCKKLEKVTLSDHLSTMECEVFKDCIKLTEIHIPKSLSNVRSEGSGVFAGSGLKQVTFEEGITQIPAYLFKGCTTLEEITIPDTVTQIGVSAFNGATGLKKIDLSSKLENIDNYAFSGCSSLKEIDIPNTVNSWGDRVFQNCTYLETVHIPDSIRNIASYSFYNCKSLKTINWPDTLQAVRKYAFYNCDALTSVELPAKVNTIEQYAFYDCDALETFTMPDTVTSLGNYAFDGCDVLKTVKLSAGLTAIPTYAFYECGSLESIVLPYRIALIGNYAFANCPKLTSVTIPRATTTFGTNLFSYPANMTIYGVAGTDAETYASNNSIHFEAIDKPATAAVFNLEELTIVKGGTGNLILTVTPSDFTDVVSWKSSDTAVATVTSAGVVTGVASGTAKIRAIIGDSGDVVASCDVTVVQPVTSIRLNKSSVTLEGGATAQLTATVNPSDAYDSTVVWTTSDETVATVTEEGLVTALKKGTATITVTANDGSGKYATCNVTVSSTAHIVDTWTELESAHNYENNTNEKWFYTLSGATALQVTFSVETFVEEDADYIYIYSGTGTLVGKYTGGALAGQTISVEGDTIQIQLVSDDVVNKYGFKVDNVTSASKPIPLQSITLSETTLRVEKGSDSQKLTILYDPENTTESKTAVWTSADESIATVAAGVVSGVSVGTTTITAEVAGKKASCKVTVWENSTTDESTTEVVVVKQKADLNAHFTGTYKKFTVDNKKLAAVSAKGILTAKQPGTVQVTGYEKNGKVWEAKETISVLIEKPLITEKTIIRTRPELTIDGSANITGAEKKPTTWISSKPAVATIDPETGLITTVGKGSTKITAVYGEGKWAAKYTFTVKVAYPAMSKKTAKLQTGATLALKLKNTKLVPEWTGSDPSVASVEAGKVTVHTIGTATITATVEGMGYTCVITVTEPTLSKKEVTLKAVGKTAKLSWKNTKLKGDSITWCSEDPTVATVDANGKITAVAAGTTNITSTVGGATGVCVVTVKGNGSSQGTGGSGGDTTKKHLYVMVDGTFRANVDNGQAEFISQWETAVSKKLGYTVKLHINQPDHYEYSDVVDTILTSGRVGDGTYPDALIMSRSMCSKYAAQGKLWDMANAYDKVDFRKRITLSDAGNPNKKDAKGQMYGFAPAYGNGCVTYIKQSWLDAIGKSVDDIKTYDDYYALLKAFHDGDPDGDGITGKTYGTYAAGFAASFEPPYIYYLPEFWQGGYPDFYQKNGKWVDGFQEQETLDALDRLAKAYADGLIDPDTGYQSTKYVRERFYDNDQSISSGAFSYWAGNWCKVLSDNLAGNGVDSKLVELPPIQEIQDTWGGYLNREAPVWVITDDGDGDSAREQAIFDALLETMMDGGTVQTLWTYGAEGVHWSTKAETITLYKGTEREVTYVYKDGEFHLRISPQDPNTLWQKNYLDPLLTIVPLTNGYLTIDPMVAESKKLFEEHCVDAPAQASCKTLDVYRGDISTFKDDYVNKVVRGEMTGAEAIAAYQKEYGEIVKTILAELNAQ